ncbi:AP-3 complex subunit delta-1 isoform X2 [Folsomia candida]|uniref:AP-3 complex subunit delta n=1 Tax=Folsomia candida TaxID=158441 RepID=A0A226DZ56_FOLCA|nr:AP-3 complex subunit delta-1 isoform X2 [Folsomia candida]OXA50499.1 AP-3 complex subunit delta-1 [Folsomia candida]
MALKKVKGNLERMFDKSMSDLVRGIRNNKDNEAKYIAQCMEEIKVELRQDNMAVKANAVAKLTYLQMCGYDISWAGFNIIEVMSSSKFTHKRIGYLSASQCFHAELEMLMLTTNMIRKDLSSQNQYEAGLALSALACFVSPDLGRDLANDIMTLLSSTKPYLRKKGVLMLYKIFLTYPDALRPAFPRLKEKLEDPDPGVQSAAVNVICELARKNPKNYLSLAPIFFKLMTSSTNNWMLIKIIKLFGALTPLEPRLGKKLIEPLTNLIHSTSAMSLLYECINTVIAGMPNHNASIQLCVQKLRILIEDSDQNLKYLGLLAMSKILTTHPKSVQTHKDLVMRCLDDKDESIRLRALDLLYGMVGKKNLMEIVKKLMVHMEKAEGTTYRDELLCKIIKICSQNNYQHITNFEWYVSVLVELARVEGLSHGDLVAAQMLDVAVRVHTIRPFAVQQMSLLLENPYVIFGFSGGNTRAPNMTQVLYAAAWICGEYIQFLPNPQLTLMHLLEPKVSQLPCNIQFVYLHNCLKILSFLLSKSKHVLPTSSSETTADLLDSGLQNGEISEKPEISKSSSSHDDEFIDFNAIQEKLKVFLSSEELEVQERAGTLHNFIKCYVKLQSKGQSDDLAEVAGELAAAFSSELNPVASKAQKKVPVPEGLDLDKWINDPPSESEEEEEEDDHVHSTEVFVKTSSTEYERKPAYQPTPEELNQQRESRKHEQKMNPHYLKDVAKSPSKIINQNGSGDVPPIAKLDLNVPLQIPTFASSDKYLDENKKKKVKPVKKAKKSKKKKKGKKSSDEEDDEETVETFHVVNTAIEMPEGATLSDTEESALAENDPHRALADIDLDMPLHPGENIPSPAHRISKQSGDPFYLKMTKDKNHNCDIREEDSAKTTEKSHKKHKKHGKSGKLKKTKGNDIDLLIEDPTQISQGTVTQNGSSQLFEELITPMEDNSKSVQDYVNNFLDDLDPITTPTTTDIQHDITPAEDSGRASKNISSDEFADLLAGGELKFKKKLEIPNDMEVKKVVSKIVKKCKMQVIENAQGCSSLYRVTSKGFHVCLLVKEKRKSSTISIEGKSNSEDAMKRTIKDITKLFKLQES